MDPLVVLLLVLVGVPVLSFVVMALFAVTADFEFEDLVVRGGHLRGAIAAAVAKIVVGDAKTFQLPLLITLRKTGIMGASTPIPGGVVVRDLEWRLDVDGEHAATITEAHSVRIGTATKRLEIPVNAEVRPPGGLLHTLRKFQKTRSAAAEVRLDVRGHVIVKHWWMTREVPVRVTRYIVLGDPVPVIERLEWAAGPIGDAPAPDEATLHITLVNPYREEVLEAPLAIELTERRRMRRDPLVGRVTETVRLEPERRWKRSFGVRLEQAAGDKPPAPDKEAKGIRVVARLRWDGDRLKPVELPEEAAAAPEGAAQDVPPALETRVRVHRVGPQAHPEDGPRARFSAKTAPD